MNTRRDIIICLLIGALAGLTSGLMGVGGGIIMIVPFGHTSQASYVVPLGWTIIRFRLQSLQPDPAISTAMAAPPE